MAEEVINSGQTWPEQRWFEDFFVGQQFHFGAYVMQRQAMLDFARDFDPEPFHIDEAAAIALGWGGLIASGPMIGAIYRRLTMDAFPNIASVISPGWDGIYWLKPVYADDVLSCQAEVLEARQLKSRPGEGMIKMRSDISQQAGELVCQVTGIWFIRSRP
jgi:acyl dehydratase